MAKFVSARKKPWHQGVVVAKFLALVGALLVGYFYRSSGGITATGSQLQVSSWGIAGAWTGSSTGKGPGVHIISTSSSSGGGGGGSASGSNSTNHTAGGSATANQLAAAQPSNDSSSSSSSSDDGGAASSWKQREEASCPFPYERLTVEQVAAGARPYLHGAGPSPCRNCNRTELWAHFCQFKSHGPVCPSHVRQGILGAWAKRGYSLPLLLTPCDLWRHLEGRTLLLMGDSQMLDFYKATFCFMFEFWDALEQEPFIKNDWMAKMLSDSGVKPTCVRLAAGVGSSTRICYVRQDKGSKFYASALPLLLKNNLTSPSDILVANFGLHHGNHDYRQLLVKFAAFYSAQRARLPRVLWQQTPPQHFKGRPGGEYGGGKPPFQCGPIEGYALEVNSSKLVLQPGAKDVRDTLRGGWRNAVADPVMRAAGIPIIHSFNESVPMWAAHRDNGQGHECTHYCFPSAPEVWVAELYRTLQQLQPAANPGV